MVLLGRKDPNQLFSYNTKQQANVEDWRLGVTNYVLQIAVLSYVVIGIFVFAKGYLEYEQALGGIATFVRGDALGVSSGAQATRYFSAEELTYPGLSNGNLFVATRQVVSKQTRGVCDDLEFPCKTNADCHQQVKGTCSKSGYCNEPSWCPSQEAPEIYDIQSGDLYIWVKSAIQFVELDPKTVYSTEDNHPYPETGYNLFKVTDLLALVKPAPLRFEDVSKLGAVIEVQFRWACEAGQPGCKPQVVAQRIDDPSDVANAGYAFNVSEPVSADVRMLNQMTGIQFLMKTVGITSKFSMMELILKAALSATLCGAVPIIVDLIMLKVLPERAQYSKLKYAAKTQAARDEAEARIGEEQELLLRRGDEGEEEIQEDDDEWHRRLQEHD